MRVDLSHLSAEERAAYEAGWRASMRTRTADLDRAESLFCSRHPDPGASFSAGWVDAACGYAKWTAFVGPERA